MDDCHIAECANCGVGVRVSYYPDFDVLCKKCKEEKRLEDKANESELLLGLFVTFCEEADDEFRTTTFGELP